jgi:hypothetical protein
MTAMIDPDILNAAEIEEAERDAWYDSICDRCGHPGRDHDDGRCPSPCPVCHGHEEIEATLDELAPALLAYIEAAITIAPEKDSGKVSETTPDHAE